MKKRRLLIVAVLGAMTISVMPNVPANATASSENSCSNSKAIFDQAHSMMPTAPSTTSDVDKDFAATEYRVAQAQVIIGHVVAKCGKLKANREAAYEMARDAERRLQLLRNQGTSF